MSFCSACGAAVSKGSRFCSECGADQNSFDNSKMFGKGPPPQYAPSIQPVAPRPQPPMQQHHHQHHHHQAPQPVMQQQPIIQQPMMVSNTTVVQTGGGGVVYAAPTKERVNHCCHCVLFVLSGGTARYRYIAHCVTRSLVSLLARSVL